jgi:hypothetical protein
MHPERSHGAAVAGLAVGLAALPLFLHTMCRTIWWHDSAEFAAVAARAGIAHPPGYPLYALLAWPFAALAPTPAFGANLFSAVSAALAVGLCAAATTCIGGSRLAGLVAGGVLATAPLFWSQAVVAEVYAPGLAALSLVLLLVVLGHQRRDARLLVAAAGVAGLGLGLHLSLATCGLGFALLALWHPGGRARRALGCLVAAAAGSLVFLWLPLREAIDPDIHPLDLRQLDQLVWYLRGGNYGNLFVAQPDGARAARFGAALLDNLGPPGLALAALGALALRRAVVGWALLLMAAGNTAFFWDYEVYDVEVFLLPSLLVLAVLGGVGAGWLPGFLGRHRVDPRIASLLALIPLARAVATHGAVDLSADRDAERYLDTLVAELPPGAAVLHFSTGKEWPFNAVFQTYGQGVLGLRPDVEVLLHAAPDEVAAMLAAGRPVYAYADIERLRAATRLRREGALWRIDALTLGEADAPPPG